jgi:hypothetical protein
VGASGVAKEWRRRYSASRLPEVRGRAYAQSRLIFAGGIYKNQDFPQVSLQPSVGGVSHGRRSC